MINGNDETIQSKDKASATAKAPMDAYLDFALWGNLLSTSLISQPDVQQRRSCIGHVQCVRSSQNSMPVSDEYVAKQVGLLRSSFLTPKDLFHDGLFGNLEEVFKVMWSIQKCIMFE